jgi:phospholipid/cholesterol/gamma-HCH transport system substrate-binding protein
MERNAHYALVGVVSLILFLGLIVFVVWLARLQFNNQYNVYDVDFKGPVRGLTSGGEVYFNGIKVGDVTKLSLDKQDPNRVVARIRTTADAPIRVDSTASLEPQGITGVSYLQITAGTVSKPLLKDVTPPGVIPVIHSQESALEGLLQGGGDVLTRTVQTLDRVNKVLSDDNIANFSATLANLKADTAMIASQRAMLADLDTTIKSIQDTSEKIAKLSSDSDQLVTGDGRRVLANLDGAVTDLRATTDQVRAVVRGLQGPTTEFATTGLPQLSRTIITLQTTAQDVDRVVNEIERNPRALLTKPPARELEVKP